MMETQMPTKRIEDYLKRIKTLEIQVKELIQSEEDARNTLYQQFMRVLTEQREEIVQLREELREEQKNRKQRCTKAIERLKSE